MKHRLLSIYLVMVVVLPLLTVFMPISTAADTSYLSLTPTQIQNATFSWQNADTITGTFGSTNITFTEDNSYSNSKGNGNLYYRAQNYDCSDPGGQGDTIEVPGDTESSGKLDMDYAPSGQVGTPNCLNTPAKGQSTGSPGEQLSITIKDTSNSSIEYTISSDGSTVTPIDNSSPDLGSFSLSSYTGIYTRDADQSAVCGDVMQVNSSYTQERIFQLVDQGASNAGKTAAPSDLHKPGCFEETGVNFNGLWEPLGGKVTNPVSPGSPGTGVGSSGTSSAPNLSCKIGGISIFNPLNWLLCAAIDGMSDIIGFADNAITSQLSVGTKGTSDVPNQIFCSSSTPSSDLQTCGAYHNAWSNFRNIALGLMVVAGLVILISQAMGMELLDAYTIRKTLPRLLIAAIAITLSWQLMGFFVQLTNDLGYGVRALIYYPFTSAGLTNSTISLNSFSANGVSLLGAIGGLALGPFGILSLAATGALALLIAFFVLVLRQIAIIMLVILAPIAIFAYILPNTQNIWKLWWDSFSRGLLMFPLIAGFIAAGHVFSLIALSGSNPSSLDIFAGFVAYFAPYFLIPATFKLAGGAVRQIGGFVNDRGRGSFDRLRNFRSNQTKKRTANAGHRALAGDIFHGAPENSRRDRLNRGVQGAALLATGEAGKNPGRMGDRIRGAREAATLSNSRKVLEAESFKPILADDNVGQAILEGHGSRAAEIAYLRDEKKYNPEQIRQAMSHVDANRSKFGQSALEQAALVSSLQASTAYDEEMDRDPDGTIRRDANGNPLMRNQGIGKVLDNIDRLSRGNIQTRAQLIGMAKEAAPRAGRPDLVASFSSMDKEARYIGEAQDPEERQRRIQEVNDRLTDETVRIEGAGYVLGGKGRAVEKFLPAMQRRISDSHGALTQAEDVFNRVGNGEQVMVSDGAGGQRAMTDDEATQQHSAAQRKYMQALASTKAFHDVAGQISEEKAALVADGLFGQGIPGTNETVLDAMNNNLDDREFNEMRNEYRSNFGRQVTEQQRQQGASQPRPQPGESGPLPGPAPGPQ